MRSLTILLTLLFCSQINLDAQLLRKLKNRVQDKVEQRIEDKVVEEVSEEIARRAMKPIDKTFDKIFREAYKEEYGEEYDGESLDEDAQRGAEMMGAILGSMYGAVDLPEAYTFDHTVRINVIDYGQRKGNEMKMLIAPNEGYFSMRQSENDDSFMVMDVKNDQVVIFNEKDKSVLAMKGVMRMAKGFARTYDNEELTRNMKFEKSGKSKKVAGYNCVGYSYTSEEDEGDFFMTNDLPFDWSDTFGSMFEEMFKDYYDSSVDFSGMLMYSESKRMSDGKKSKWEVKKIENKTTTIDCSKYKLANDFSK